MSNLDMSNFNMFNLDNVQLGHVKNVWHKMYNHQWCLTYGPSIAKTRSVESSAFPHSFKIIWQLLWLTKPNFPVTIVQFCMYKFVESYWTNHIKSHCIFRKVCADRKKTYFRQVKISYCICWIQSSPSFRSDVEEKVDYFIPATPFTGKLNWLFIY